MKLLSVNVALPREVISKGKSVTTVTGQSNRPVSDQTKRPLDQGASPIRARSGFDFGAGALMLALALFVWTRLRA